MLHTIFIAVLILALIGARQLGHAALNRANILVVALVLYS